MAMKLVKEQERRYSMMYLLFILVIIGILGLMALAWYGDYKRSKEGKK